VQKDKLKHKLEDFHGFFELSPGMFKAKLAWQYREQAKCLINFNACLIIPFDVLKRLVSF